MLGLVHRYRIHILVTPARACAGASDWCVCVDGHCLSELDMDCLTANEIVVEATYS